MTPRAAVLVSIAIGGAIGATIRTALTASVGMGHQPYVTLGVNIIGTVILVGMASLIAWRPHLPHWLNPMVGVGFCGSLTTFSTMQLEVVAVGRGGLTAWAFAYLASSIVLGLAAAIATRGLARRVIA